MVKGRIIAALKRAGHTVGYLGDGVNDAPPLHAADVGLSVDTAVAISGSSSGRTRGSVLLVRAPLGQDDDRVRQPREGNEHATGHPAAAVRQRQIAGRCCSSTSWRS